MADNSEFVRSDLINIIGHQDTYGLDDVGITSPYSDAYIKVSRDGEIHIYAGNGTGIFMNPTTRTVTIMGDQVKLLTNNEDGLRWNELSFNSQATSYTEPSLVPYDQDAVPNLYRDLDDYLGS